MRIRHGVPGIKMEDDLLRSYILYILAHGRGSIGHILLSVNVKFTIVNEYCRVAGVFRFTMAKKPVWLRRVIQHLVPIWVRSDQEEADVSIVNKNQPVVNNVRDNVDARSTRRNTALNADILRRLRS